MFNREIVAKELYTSYCAAVGGVAFNGDPLPDWETFAADETKQKQSAAWLAAADRVLSLGASATAGTFWRLDCDIIQGPRDAGVKFATAATPAIAVRLCELLNLEDGPVKPLERRIVELEKALAGARQKGEWYWGQEVTDYVKDYVDGYAAGDDAQYEPSENERGMIQDAILGLLSEPEFIGLLPTGSVVQRWVNDIPRMQQSVLFSGLRGPDGVAKYSPAKMLLRWYRRCVLLSALDGMVLDNPCSDKGGSFTGQSLCLWPVNDWEAGMKEHVDDYLRALDSLPHHFLMHFLHGIEILGFKHPEPRIREWWLAIYGRLVLDMNLHPESEAQLDDRLGDSRSGWLNHADPATIS